MDIELTDISDKKATMVISDTSPAFVNAIRRSLMTDVPKMAIEDVEFHLGPIRDEEGNEYESMTPFFDEIVAHRLGLVPVPTDLSLFVRRDECSCEGEGCPNCTIMYALNKKGPCTVYSGDLEPLGDAKFSVVDDLVPIVELDKGQALLVYATAVLGDATEHIKWQVTTGVGYKPYPKVDISSKKCDLCEECVEICPPKILEIKKKKLVVTDVDKCILCNSCQETCEMDAIEVGADKEKYILHFETDGSLSPKDALTYALFKLEETYDELKAAAAGLK